MFKCLLQIQILKKIQLIVDAVLLYWEIVFAIRYRQLYLFSYLSLICTHINSRKGERRRHTQHSGPDRDTLKFAKLDLKLRNYIPGKYQARPHITFDARSQRRKGGEVVSATVALSPCFLIAAEQTLNNNVPSSDVHFMRK